MKLTIWLVALAFTIGTISHAQQSGIGSLNDAAQSSFSGGGAYTVQGTTPEREQLLRTQIVKMQPAVLPYRVVFVPHWQYLYAVKMYKLHLPSGMSCKMFTHLPSRSIFIDNDLYGGADWLGHWMAHELGHLERNNADEGEAERAAKVYRTRLNPK